MVVRNSFQACRKYASNLLFLCEFLQVNGLVMGGYSHEFYQMSEALVIIELAVNWSRPKGKFEINEH
jgi:prophage maintenance system killer protein